MKNIVLSVMLLLGIVGCKNDVPVKNESNAIVGHWYYDLKASEAHAKDGYEKSIMQSVAGEEAQFDNKGNFLDKGNKVVGAWKQEGDTYTITYDGSRTMIAKREGAHLVIVQRGMSMYFRTQKSDVNAKSISDYVYLNTPYRQKTLIYDNGYLYYLFLNNGIVYSYVSLDKQVKAEEILKKGDKFKYKYSNDQILIKALMTISIKAKTKGHLKTSQDDELMVQK